MVTWFERIGQVRVALRGVTIKTKNKTKKLDLGKKSGHAPGLYIQKGMG